MSELLPLFASIIVISLSGVMMPGPMFAVALAKSYRSPLAGTFMSLGHAVIEIPIILVIYFGFARFFSDTMVQTGLSIAGGLMIIYMGLGMYRSRHEVVRGGKDLPYNAFTAGILMTGANPFFILWWATVGGLLIMRVEPYGGLVFAGFILVHWLCDLVWLSFVSVTVHKTHRLWGGRGQLWVFVASSLLLAGFGFWFMISGIRNLL